MRLFHNSNERLTKLTPYIGTNRHSGEDPRAVGKAVVWLSNQPQISAPPAGYMYIVEIDENDPDLYIDEPFDRLQQDMGKLFNTIIDWRWYFCFREINIKEIYQWNMKTNQYELI